MTTQDGSFAWNHEGRTMMSRRSFIEGAIVLGSLGTWVAPGIWMRVLQPPGPAPLSISGTLNGGLKGSISGVVSLGPAPPTKDEPPGGIFV